MKNLFILSCFVIGCLIVSCGGDDNGTNGGDDDEIVVPRLVANTSADAPSTTDANDAVWSTLDSTMVQIGFSETYGQNPRMIKDTMWMKAILKSDKLYIWAKWEDPDKSVWGNYMIKSFALGFWEHITTYELGGGEDAFMIVFDAGDNGDEGADCATMCHLATSDMRTTGGGHADAWCWKSAKLAPANLAEDYWWASSGNFLDPAPATGEQKAYEVNSLIPIGEDRARPKWMHTDDTAFAGPYLFREDAIEFEPYIGWDEIGGYKMPGHRIDSTIHSKAERNDRYDVLAASVYDEASTPHTWTVVFSRSLTPSGSNDVDLRTVDSIQVTVAATRDHTYGSDPNMREHSGSVPFYIILPRGN